MNLLRCIRLWSKMAGREWDDSEKIPEPYRVRFRIGIIMAWQIAWNVHMRRANGKQRWGV